MKVIQSIENDLAEFLMNDSEEIITNQRQIGWKQAFRGYVVLFWSNKCKENVFNYKINKIIEKCVLIITLNVRLIEMKNFMT